MRPRPLRSRPTRSATAAPVPRSHELIPIHRYASHPARTHSRPNRRLRPRAVERIRATCGSRRSHLAGSRAEVRRFPYAPQHHRCLAFDSGPTRHPPKNGNGQKAVATMNRHRRPFPQSPPASPPYALRFVARAGRARPPDAVPPPVIRLNKICGAFSQPCGAFRS